MTVRQMALAQRIQETTTSTAKKYSLAKGDHPHLPGSIEGMCLACYGDHKDDDVGLSASVVQQVKDLALTSAKDSYGWNDTPYLNNFIRSYLPTVNEVDKRLATSRALTQVWREECDRIGWYIHSQNPNWTTWGQPFDLSILDGYKQSQLDVRA